MYLEMVEAEDNYNIIYIIIFIYYNTLLLIIIHQSFYIIIHANVLLTSRSITEVKHLLAPCYLRMGDVILNNI